MRTFIVGFCFLLVFSQSLMAAEDKVNLVPNKAGEKPLITVDEKGNLYILHYGNDEALYILKNNKVIDRIQKEGTSGTFKWLGFPDGKPSVIWRPKFSDSGNKFLYFNIADEKTLKFDKEVVINNAKDVLPPVDVDVKDKMIFVSWADERKGSSNIYMNFSSDGGKTFRQEDMNLTPEYASSLHDLITGQKNFYFFFHGKKKEDMNAGIYVRMSDDGIQWSEIQPIVILEDWAPFTLEAVMTSDGPVILWAGTRGIWYAYADTNGKWHTHLIEKTKDMNVNRLEIKQSKDGHIYIISSYIEKEEQIRKPSVYFLSSTDNGRTWFDPVKINHNKYDNTSAKFPDMYVRDDGTIVVVWQDHRLIRGNIYLNYSKDGGKTWLPEDINTDDNPGKYNDFYPFITGYKDKVYVLIPRHKDDSVRGDELDLYLKEVKIKD